MTDPIIVVPVNRPNDAPFELSLRPGDMIFAVGANGTGKSSLMHKVYLTSKSVCRRITAHRQNWFETGELTITPKQRTDMERDIHSQDALVAARWYEWYAAERAQVAIFDLVHAENVRAQGITAAVDNGDMDRAEELSKIESPIRILNRIIHQSNLPIAVRAEGNQKLVAIRDDGIEYDIAQLSDGERNALLIAANVLTVPDGTLLLIDEPERHLHRSIISPLLTSLFLERPLCAYLISTHEIMLPIDNSSARVLLVRSCYFGEEGAEAWDLDELPAGGSIPEDLKLDVLGSRRRALFVEGNQKSLDLPLYSVLFPKFSVVAKGSCRGVQRSVTGIRDSAELHWVAAYGLVDGDGRTESEKDSLRSAGVFPISFFSVESLYYHPDVIQIVAASHAAVIGDDASELATNAKAGAIKAIRPEAARLAAKAAERTVRDHVLSRMPTLDSIERGDGINVQVNVKDIVTAEAARLVESCESDDLASIIENYPIKETPLPSVISKALKFQKREDYEKSVRHLIENDGEMRVVISKWFKEIHAAIG